MSRYLLNGAYSKTGPDDLIERCPENWGPACDSSDSCVRSLGRIADGPFKTRVIDAIEMIKAGRRTEAQRKHGRVVFRQALKLWGNL